MSDFNPVALAAALRGQLPSAPAPMPAPAGRVLQATLTRWQEAEPARQATAQAIALARATTPSAAFDAATEPKE